MRTSAIFLTVDTVILKLIGKDYHILLIQRRNNPFKDFWSLPGGFVDENEDLEIAAKRELFEETCVKIENLEQLKAFGKPFRDPRSHMVTVAFLGFVLEETIAIAADDAKDVKWISVNNLPELAFDHDEIINFALTKVKDL
ncbi:NUDIX domain-containing protein [Flavobacterium sp.]|uniref:NUDIX domain-containing protein n=1 Tax=Flavobacterium sp. TaxID=239 RepID=UPI003753474C